MRDRRVPDPAAVGSVQKKGVLHEHAGQSEFLVSHAGRTVLCGGLRRTARPESESIERTTGSASGEQEAKYRMENASQRQMELRVHGVGHRHLSALL